MNDSYARKNISDPISLSLWVIPEAYLLVHIELAEDFRSIQEVLVLVDPVRVEFRRLASLLLRTWEISGMR